MNIRGQYLFDNAAFYSNALTSAGPNSLRNLIIKATQELNYQIMTDIASENHLEVPEQEARGVCLFIAGGTFDVIHRLLEEAARSKGSSGSVFGSNNELFLTRAFIIAYLEETRGIRIERTPEYRDSFKRIASLLKAKTSF